MKKIFLALIAPMIAIACFAQTNLVATLTHGDEIKMFYGTYALQNAHAAASHGDIINLSGGTFQATSTISKAISIRGTGINDTNPTIINGSFTINIPGDVIDRLNFEGCIIVNSITVSGTLANALFLKNYINRIDVSSSGAKMLNAMFANCQIYGMDLYGASKIQFTNSYISGFYNRSSTASANFINCVIYPAGGYLAAYIRNSQLINCILRYGTNYSHNDSYLPATSSANNCIATGSNYVFQYVQSKQKCYYANIDIFRDSNPLNDLTDEAKEKYIGSDGTPIGMYGGMLPYNMTPNYPLITKMNVANKTTTDGKLDVEIEVSSVK